MKTNTRASTGGVCVKLRVKDEELHSRETPRETLAKTAQPAAR